MPRRADAENDPVLRSGRVGAIELLPPVRLGVAWRCIACAGGTRPPGLLRSLTRRPRCGAQGDTPFRLQITAAASQPLPFKLKNFRASGTTGVVNVSGNPADTDFEAGTFAGGSTTKI